jgi:hypothetical protein
MNQIRLFVALGLLCLTSCASIMRNIIGLKNPKVLDKEEVIAELNSTFSKDTTARVVDYRFIKMTDTMDQARLILSSIVKRRLLFNSEGKRWCYTGPKETCGGAVFYNIVKDNYKVLALCHDSFLKKDTSVELFHITKLEDVTRNLQFISSSQSLPKANLYAIYHWSQFCERKKKKRNEFNEFVSEIRQIDSNFCILRINSDFTSDYYEKKRTKFKMKIEKGTGTLTINDLPKPLNK